MESGFFTPITKQKFPLIIHPADFILISSVIIHNTCLNKLITSIVAWIKNPL